jgi:hypothetical protein
MGICDGKTIMLLQYAALYLFKGAAGVLCDNLDVHSSVGTEHRQK